MAESSPIESDIQGSLPKPDVEHQANKDIAAEALNQKSDERYLAYKDIIPQLDQYGLTFKPSHENKNLDSSLPIVMLPEPAGYPGEPGMHGYVIVTAEGPKIAYIPEEWKDVGPEDMSHIDTEQSAYYGQAKNGEPIIVRLRSRSDPKGLSAGSLRLHLGRDAKPEEAMQALGRSIRRKDYSLPKRPFMPKEKPTEVKLGLKDKLQLKVTPEPYASHKRHHHEHEAEGQRKVAENEAYGKHFREHTERARQLTKLRKDYIDEPFVLAQPNYDLKELNKIEKAKINTPNKANRDAELQRIDAAKRMKGLLEQPLAQIQQTPQKPAA